MKPVPLVLLLASVLLAAHVRPYTGRPRTPPSAGLDASGRYKSRLDEVLAAAPADGAVSYLLGDKLLHILQRTLPHGALLRFPIAEEPAADGEALLSHLASGLASLETELRAPAAAEGNSLDELVGLSKRNDDPPISIDLTFHLLRNMIEMAKIESQKEQAELNRKFLDEVGK
ncbi:unnamed protein product [Merluccius merluccius]